MGTKEPRQILFCFRNPTTCLFPVIEKYSTLIWLGLIFIGAYKWNAEGHLNKFNKGSSMKSVLSFSGGLIFGAVIFGIGGIFFGFNFGHYGEPSVIVRNFTHSTIQQIRIETDIGETYTFQNIPPDESRRTQIAKGDMALWVVATSLAGEPKKSKQIYISSSGTVFVAVSDDAITLDYSP